MQPFRTTWTQYQGDSASSGYAALLTAATTRTKWTRPAINIGNGSSPVVDPAKGAIYICDTTGHLWRYDDEGTHGITHWARTVAENAHGYTPAVDSAGRIYAIFNWGAQPDGSDWSGVLACLSPDGVEQWRYQPPPFTSANMPSFLGGCPKVWRQPDGETLIFFLLFWVEFNANLLHSLLVVVNERGIPQSTAELGASLIFEAHGGGGFRLRDPGTRPHADISSPVVETPPIVGVAPSGGSDIVSLPRDTVLPWGGLAVFDNGPQDQPVIVATDGDGHLAAWRWQDRAGFLPLWRKDFDVGGLGPPAVLPSGLLAVGGSDSVVRLLDPMTGNEFRPWPELDGRVWGPPASFLRHLYVGSMGGDFAMIDSNGKVVHKASLGAQCATPALVTGSFVYVAAANGFYVFDFFLSTKIAVYGFHKCGQSSPAVGQDGTIYLVADDLLHAFETPSSQPRPRPGMSPG